MVRTGVTYCKAYDGLLTATNGQKE